MNELLLNMLAATLATIGKQKFIEVLQQLHDKNKTSYEAAIKGGHVLIAALKPLTDKSKSPIDDAVLASLGDAIEFSAKVNNVTL